MFILFKWLKWRKPLEGANYETAKMLLANHFQESMITTDFDRVLDHFLAEPCFDTAADLLEAKPELISFFKASKGGNKMSLLFKKGYGEGKK